MPVREAVPLWEGVAPGSEGWTWQERSLKLAAPSTEYAFLLNVVQPTLTPVLPDPAAATGAAVVVCPGGGYAMLAIAHEGFDVAHWLAEHGIAAFVLKYRVMETPEGDDLSVLRAAPDTSGLAALLRRMDEFAPIPLADGIAALGHVRARARSGASRPTASAPSASRRARVWSSIWPRTTTATSGPRSREPSTPPVAPGPFPTTPHRSSSPPPPTIPSSTGRSRPTPRGGRPGGRSRPTSTVVAATGSA